MAFPEIIKTHPTSIKERSAPDKQACQFLDQISDASRNGTPILSLGIFPSVILIIQSYPTSTPLKYLCADEGQSFDFANFSSAERNCSLRNITSAYEDSLLDMEISDPIWIKYEALDRSEVLWMELDLDKRSCQREKSQPKVFDSDVDLQKTLRVVKYENFSVQIQSCCDKRSPDVTTVSMTTTPTGKHRRTPDLTTSLPPEKTSTANKAITMLMIFIAAIFLFACLIFIICKVCCTPKSRPSYKVEYADPSDVIISSSGAEYSTPYDTCQSRTRVKVSGATKEATAKKRKVSMKKISRRFTSSRSKGRKRENDSGYSDLLESEASKMSARDDAKEAQYMEIPLANIPVSRTLGNPSYTYVEGKINGKALSNKDRKMAGFQFTIPISEPKGKVESAKARLPETNLSENPYDVVSESDKNIPICDLSSSEGKRNLVENPYAVPDCGTNKESSPNAQESDNSCESPSTQLEDCTSDEARPKTNPVTEENPYM
ncbi:uncharacterized protein LOC111135821 isoform X3 [Crassostrea virginica]|nr:uncharacterized protein LOC111135821 isoform X3 [Crassostrea virginica]